MRSQDPRKRDERQHPGKASQSRDGHWWLGTHLECGADLDDYLPALGCETGEFGRRGFRYVEEVLSGCFPAVSRVL